MKVAALDLGTNSFLCLISEVESGQVTHVYSDQVKVVRLGQEVNKTRKFHPDALLRARECLTEFAEVIHQHQPDRVLAMATSAARDVVNSDELFKIGRDLAIPIEIIPGGREAEITFQGATADLPKDGKQRLVIDVGGGSTEYILGKDQKVQLSESVNIGCVRLTEALVTQQPTSAKEVESVQRMISEKTKNIIAKLKKERIDEIIAVAGTPSAIAAIELGGFSFEKVDGYFLTLTSLKSWVQKFSEMSVEQKIRDLGLESGRADVILVGAIILLNSLEALQMTKMTVSIKGVRYGVAIDLASR